MQVAKERNVVFWDRLEGMWRFKDDSEKVMRGGKGNLLRIFQMDDAAPFMRVTCSYQEVLHCYLGNWPSHVTEEGTTIHLWLFDQSLARNYKRKFEFEFADEQAAKGFFECYTSLLDPCKPRGRTYHEMKDGTDCSSSDEEKSVDLLVGKKESSNEEENTNSNEESEEENAEDVTADDDDMDDLARILAEDQNWGNSQSFMNPLRPFDK